MPRRSALKSLLPPAYIADGSNTDHLLESRMSGFANCGHWPGAALSRSSERLCSFLRVFEAGVRPNNSLPPREAPREARPATPPSKSGKGK